MKKKSVFIFVLDSKVKEFLQEQAKKTGRSTADLVREAIAHYWLEKLDKQKNSPVLK